MTDKERIHRWITQADLERMMDNEYRRGLNEAAWLLEEAKRDLLRFIADDNPLIGRIDRFLDHK